MCVLTERLFELEDMFIGDAVVIQSATTGETVDYGQAKAIIRRVEGKDKDYWMFNNLFSVDSGISGCGGIKGTIPEIVRNAFYQFGMALYENMFVTVSYTDDNFPKNLLPQ